MGRDEHIWEGVKMAIGGIWLHFGHIETGTTYAAVLRV